MFFLFDTPPKFNIAPENGGWKTTFLLGRKLFRGYVKLWEGIYSLQDSNPSNHGIFVWLFSTSKTTLPKFNIAPEKLPFQ